MGRKSKPEEPEQYEIWILYETGDWKQVQEHGDPIFTKKARALAIGQQKSGGAGVVETLVIARRSIAVFNGEAIGVKHNLKKKEKVDAEVQRDRQEEGHVGDPGPEHVGEAAPGGAGREGAPPG